MGLSIDDLDGWCWLQDAVWFRNVDNLSAVAIGYSLVEKEEEIIIKISLNSSNAEYSYFGNY